MRLDRHERAALSKATEGLREVYLFGSRTDDAARGGDIDLLVFSDQPPFDLARRISREFFLACEEKIDVVVVNPAALTNEQAAFIRTLRLEKLR